MADGQLSIKQLGTPDRTETTKALTLRGRVRIERGQSLTEIALFLPILILMLAGFVEIGVLVNSYITAQDASRAAARYVAAGDPVKTRCQYFGPASDPQRIQFSTDPCQWEYPAKAAIVKSWGAGGIYDVCQDSPTYNFYYIAGCLAVLNMPRGALDPNPKSIWSANDYPGDDVIVTTIPISNGQVVYNGAAIWWSLYGNQPTTTFPSFVMTPGSDQTFVANPSFINSLGTYASAPASGLVVVEVYHAHPQFLKLFTLANRLVGSGVILPDPIPIHTFTIFPLPAVEP